MSCTGYPRRSSTIILSRKASVAEPSLRKQYQSIVGGIGRACRVCARTRPPSARFGPITWSTPGRRGPGIVPASDNNPDRRPRAEGRVRRFIETLARPVGECAPCRPTFRREFLVVVTSSAHRWSTLDAGWLCDLLRARIIASIAPPSPFPRPVPGVCRPRHQRLAITCAHTDRSVSAIASALDCARFNSRIDRRHVFSM